MYTHIYTTFFSLQIPMMWIILGSTLFAAIRIYVYTYIHILYTQIFIHICIYFYMNTYIYIYLSQIPMMWIVLGSTLFAAIRILLATIDVGVDGEVCIYQFWFGHISFIGKYIYVYIYIYIYIYVYTYIYISHIICK
jgi:hypothetical protein